MRKCIVRLWSWPEIISILWIITKVKSERIYNDILQECPTEINHYLQHSVSVPYGVPDRALKTLPPELTVRSTELAEGELGVFSNTFIPKFTFIAEYEGVIFPAKEEQGADYTYQWLLYAGDDAERVLLVSDSLDVHTSNWARYVNCARNVTELNVLPLWCYSKLYYMTSRDIYPTQELLTYYGPDYAVELGIDPTPFETEY